MLLHGEVLQGVRGLLMWGASATDGACVCSCTRMPHQQPMHTPSAPHTSFCVSMLIISYLIIRVFKDVVESLLLDMNFQVVVMLWGYIYFYVF